MKTLKTVLFGIIAASSVVLATAQASAASIEPNLERDLVRVCEALKDNDRMALNKAVKLSRVSYKNLVEGLKCNGMSALEFAHFHKSDKAANLLALRANLRSDELVAKR